MQLRIYKDNILGEYMAGIIYTTNKSGDRVGRWSGKSYRDENGKPQKTGQLYLGKVIDEERLIFSRKRSATMSSTQMIKAGDQLRQGMFLWSVLPGQTRTHP